MTRDEVREAVRAALDECESCCLDDKDDRQRVEETLLSHLIKPPTLRRCEPCGGPGPVLYDVTTQRYSCRSCHSNPSDSFFERHSEAS